MLIIIENKTFTDSHVLLPLKVNPTEIIKRIWIRWSVTWEEAWLLLLLAPLSGFTGATRDGGFGQSQASSQVFLRTGEFWSQTVIRGVEVREEFEYCWLGSILGAYETVICPYMCWCCGRGLWCVGGACGVWAGWLLSHNCCLYGVISSHAADL